MKIDVVGVGAAYEALGVNASLLLEEDGYQCLIDCGPTVPPALWRRGLDPEAISALYFTHCHPDHCLGLTTLINHWQHCQRKTPLLIVAQRAQWARLQNLSYFGHWPDDDPGFSIQWVDSTELDALGPWRMATATSRHSVPNRSLWLRGAQGSLFYSGDGRPSRHNKSLLASADIVFQECEVSQSLSRLAHHGDWPLCQELERKNGSLLCPYHIGTEHQALIRQAAAAIKDIYVPREGDCLRLKGGRWQIEERESQP